ncbi:MAG: AraC family transcriptional regulator [Xanthobacteraceae bacterium]|nr:AraC family transcriptional regulator [Xanthobacteraceae bacterium]
MSSALKDAIARRIGAISDGDGFFPSGIEGVTLTRSRTDTIPHHVLYKPALCVVAQGAKQVMLGDKTLHYGEMQSLVVNVEMPLVGNVTRATDKVPFLGIIIEFDTRLMHDVLDQLDNPPKPNANHGPAVFIQDMRGPLADSVLRLINLDTPQAIAVLAPSVLREIYFWLLTGPNSSEICKHSVTDSHTERLTRAIHLLRDLSRPARSEQLAAAAQMSPSSFHQHFKALTSMTPLQYQKQLRLLEARRLMLTSAITATTAAYQVGYESASQFSREYARMFGAPPRRDVKELRGLPLSA